ncbi:MAG: membrane protein insertase YidC [Proteobacteria bacterium]|nr:membrane protein insertase YidC [Pseudomonadota bacterium]
MTSKLKELVKENFNNFYKIVLYLAITLIGVLLWNAWNKEFGPNKNVPVTNSNVVQSSQDHFVPPSYNSSANQVPMGTSPPPISPVSQQNTASNSKVINVKTDVLDVNIDLTEGSIIDAKLNKYKESVENPVPMSILDSDPNHLYLAQTGLKANNASQTETVNYHANQTNYQLGKDQNSLDVQISGMTPSGLQVLKTFKFERGKYNVQVGYQIKNTGSQPWVGNTYQQIVRKNTPPLGAQHTRSYNGAAISSLDKPYEKLPFKKLNSEQINQNVQGGWVAMQQPYFLTAWIPPSDQSNHFYSSVSDNVYTLGYVSPPLKIDPNSEISQQSTLYVGPELPDDLKKLAKGLDLTIDYGWLWMFSKVIFWVMDHIHSLVGNWGWSIIITTLLIKLLFYKLSEKSYSSMAKMREIQPRLQALKDRYGDDKQALSKATMDFYKNEKINPLGGCLPTIIQIPVFIALYYVLIESVQLRQAPFILWIKDLSVHDPYYVLPILMGASMFLQQKLSPPPPDPTQAKMMMFLPVIFTVFFLQFPAGLVLYWLVNNCASILQQWYVMKTYKKRKPKVTKKVVKKNRHSSTR